MFQNYFLMETENLSKRTEQLTIKLKVFMKEELKLIK